MFSIRWMDFVLYVQMSFLEIRIEDLRSLVVLLLFLVAVFGFWEAYGGSKLLDRKQGD